MGQPVNYWEGEFQGRKPGPHSNRALGMGHLSPRTTTPLASERRESNQNILKTQNLTFFLIIENFTHLYNEIWPYWNLFPSTDLSKCSLQHIYSQVSNESASCNARLPGKVCPLVQWWHECQGWLTAFWLAVRPDGQERFSASYCDPSVLIRISSRLIVFCSFLLPLEAPTICLPTVVF